MSNRCAAALALILIAAAALRWHAIGRAPFGIDELFTVHFATGVGPWETAIAPGEWLAPGSNMQSMTHAAPAWRIWVGMGYDTHPPLHPLLLRGWMAIFGDGDKAARSPSVALSLLMILLVFDFARVCGGAGAGLWAAAIAAVAGPQIEYAQECRSYMLLTACCAAAGAAAARIVVLGPTRRRSIVFAVIALLSMLTHYWAIGFLVPIAIVLARVCWSESNCDASRDRLGAVNERLSSEPLPNGRGSYHFIWFFLAIAATVYLVSWAPFAWQQRANFSINLNWLADDDPGLLLRSLRRAALIPLRLLFAPPGPLIEQSHARETIQGCLTAFAYLLPALLAWRLRNDVKNPRGRTRLASDRSTYPGLSGRGVAIASACFFGPVLLSLLADVSQHRLSLNLIRYTLPGSVGFYVLLAVAGAGRWQRQAIPLTALVACAGALPMAWQRDKPPWRELAREATAGLSSMDRVVLVRDQPWRGSVVFMAVNRYAAPLPCPMIVLDRPASTEVMRELFAARHLVVISDAIDPPVRALFPSEPLTAAPHWVPMAGGYAVVTFDRAAPPAR